MADACTFLMEQECISHEIYNVGSGDDVTIRELAEIVLKTVGFTGEIVFDASKPDGMFRKLLDVTRMAKLGWTSKIKLENGVKLAYRAYCDTLMN
jgi:GDP-L-fucose synthase